MNRILTWGEFKSLLKEELEIQEDQADVNDFLKALANEALYEIVGENKNAREFAMDYGQSVIDPSFITFNTIAIGAIEQIYYLDNVANMRWDLTEQTGIVGLPAVRGRPNAYTLTQGYNPGNPNIPEYSLTFYPLLSGNIGDFVQIVGTLVPLIDLDADVMNYYTFYAAIKLRIIERYIILRNENINKTQVIGNILNRANQSAGQGQDLGNSQSQPALK